MFISSAGLFAAGSFAPPAQVPPPEIPEPTPAWTWSLSGYTVNPPDDDAYVSTILRADKDVLHLEGRYNYEDRDTGSLWVGRNFTWSEDVDVLLVPMLGAVVGNTDGAALGVEFDATWKRLGFYSESEYLFDFADADDNFLFTWSELTFAATDWLEVGLVAQRTRVFDQDLEIDRGLLVNLARGPVSASFYWFNPDRDDPYAAFTIGFGW